MTAPRRAVFGLGANLGDTVAALQGAVDVVAGHPGVRAVAVSPVYDTAPVGGPEQPRYLNAVLVVDTVLPATDLLALAHEAEQAFGRVRDVRWGPRTLDVDLLAVGRERSDDPELTLPHPRAHERAFVLVPWVDVEPDAVLAGVGPLAVALAALAPGAAAEMHRRDDLALSLPAEVRP